MDPFAVIILGGTAGLFIALLLLGKYYPGSGADQIDWKPTRSVDVEVQNEIDDLDQMREAVNERRRRRGEAELTEESIRAKVAADVAEQARLRDAYVVKPDDHALVQQEIAALLALKNDRRRRKGLPEITEEEYRAQLDDAGA
jgi:hypothetical protein